MTTSTPDRQTDPHCETLRRELSLRLARYAETERVIVTPIPGFLVSMRTAPSACLFLRYEPELVLFLQGEKQIELGGTLYRHTGGSFLLTSIDLPVMSQITRATPEEPYLAAVQRLDMNLVREMMSREEFPPLAPGQAPQGMASGVATAEMLDAVLRLVKLLERPAEIAVLADLIQRELVFRVLQGPQGGHLRAIATLGDQSQRTAKAVAWLRDNYTKTLRMEELAEVAQMGVSTLHHHFRSLTSMSPLQYQKRLRLHTARERMLLEGIDAASAAFEVGYESPSQFSREYRRLFGQPPMRDVKTRRTPTAEAAYS
ncbi:MAG: AraC family transcriptional regulator [Acidobacteriota bacterium]|nr:AraC family transcriptional regulator [Acidobacteriota bacterium]